MSQSLSYNMISVVQLFTGPDVYRVPDYQRRYAWKQEVVEDFWLDISEACKSQMKQYFLGTTVIIPRDLLDGSYHEIVDGQQRLATLSILLAAIRDCVSQSEASDTNWLCSQIQNLLTYTDPITRRKRPRVKLGESDDSYFSNNVIETEVGIDSKRTNASTDSQKRILSAYMYFLDRIKETTNRENNGWLPKYYKYLTENVVMMSIRAAEDSDAFHVFESINARGTDLSHMDLLKSFLMSRVCEIDRQEVGRQWGTMMSRFSETAAFRYFRYYWMSKFELLRKMNLYRKVKRKVLTEIEPRKLVENLESESRIYKMIIRADVRGNRNVQHHLSALRSLGATQIHPILLAAASRFTLNSQQFEDIVRTTGSFVIRKFVIGGERPGVFEMEAGRLARAIRFSKMNTAGLLKSLKKMAPTDKEFEDAFAECSMRSVRAAKYILKEIEATRRRTRETAVLDTVDLEHILPKKPDDHWLRGFGDEDTKDWIHRLGNQTVMDRGLNRGIQNRSFTKKKKKYAISEIKITKDLTKLSDWGPKEIQKRQRKFAKVAVNIWKI